MAGRIAILTGGGDAPGLNGIIESTTKTLLNFKYEVIGICDGFEGVFESRTRRLYRGDVDGIHAFAGTILGTSNRCGTEGREKEFIEKFRKLQVDGLVVAGGDGTFRGLQAFRNEIPLYGIPKTIDNDLSGTDITFGYDTACATVADAVNSLRTTANAHRRIIFVETMGRTAGWIALGGGLASYADAILIPERPFDPDQLLNFVKSKQSGQRSFICVVAEGAHAKSESAQVAFEVLGSPQKERYGGIAEYLARTMEKPLNWDARHVVLGHLQRSHNPTTTDRFLTLAMGVEAARMVMEKDSGKAAVYIDGQVTRSPIENLMREPRLVDPEHRWVHLAQTLGIFI